MLGVFFCKFLILDVSSKGNDGQLLVTLINLQFFQDFSLLYAEQGCPKAGCDILDPFGMINNSGACRHAPPPASHPPSAMGTACGSAPGGGWGIGSRRRSGIPY